MTPGATREICDLCDEESAVGFSVPDGIWRKVADSITIATTVGNDFREAVNMDLPPDILCLRCFTDRADELGLKWDADIQFWPVSVVTLRGDR